MRENKEKSEIKQFIIAIILFFIKFPQNWSGKYNFIEKNVSDKVLLMKFIDNLLLWISWDFVIIFKCIEYRH